MTELTTLAEAIAEHVRDGDRVCLEGFSHLIPFAAAHELLRQERRELELIRLTPDLIADQLIGAGAVNRLVFSWGGNPGVGSLHRFRDAVEHGWPRPIELEEHSHAGMVNRFVAGAGNLPFAVMRGYIGSDLPKHTPTVASIVCPFSGERLAVVAALNPDVTVVHAQQADRQGNVLLWGITGVQKEAVLAARRVIVTVEEVVARLVPGTGAVLLPSWVIDAVALVPGGAWPSYAAGYSTRDNAFYSKWDALSSDRTRFTQWMDRHVLGVADWGEHRRSLEAG